VILATDYWKDKATPRKDISRPACPSGVGFCSREPGYPGIPRDRCSGGRQGMTFHSGAGLEQGSHHDNTTWLWYYRHTPAPEKYTSFYLVFTPNCNIFNLQAFSTVYLIQTFSDSYPSRISKLLLNFLHKKLTKSVLTFWFEKIISHILTEILKNVQALAGSEIKFTCCRTCLLVLKHDFHVMIYMFTRQFTCL